MTGEGLWDSLMRNPYYEGFHASSHLLGYNHVLRRGAMLHTDAVVLGAARGVGDVLAGKGGAGQQGGNRGCKHAAPQDHA